MTRALVAVVAPCVLATFGGCFGESEETCEYWISQLEKDKREKDAIEKIGELECKEGIDVLAAKFPESLYRRQILATVKQLGKTDKAVEIVRSALPDKEVGPLAIRLAVEWKVDTIKDDLAKLIRSARSASNRLQALEALVELTSPKEALDTLIWAVGQEPTLQGVETNSYAAKQLAKIDWKQVDDAKATEAAEQLIRALFMTDAKGSSAQIDARFALRAIGPQATEPVLGAFKGVNKDLNEFAEIRGLPKWKFTQGHELVEMLWDVGDKRASPVLMEALGIPLDPPPPDVARLPEDQRDAWKTANQNRLATTALTVGALVNDEAVRYAVNLLKRKNPPPDASQFLNAGLGLGLMGTESARDALWQLFSGDEDTVEEKRKKIAELKAAVEKEGDEEKKKALMKQHDELIDDVNGIEARKANFVTNLAIGLGPKRVDKFKAEVLDVEEGPIAESGNAPLPIAYYETVQECGNKVDCYAKIIETQKGSYAEIPKAMEKAQETLSDEKKKLIEAVKPITERIKTKNKEVKTQLEQVLELKKKIEASPDTKDKKELEAKNELIKQFNEGLDKYNALREEVEKIYKERNDKLAELDPFEKALENEQKKLYRLEKAALMLGTFDEGKDKTVALIAEVFPEATPPYYQQFRQWALISLEHHADKDDLATLEALLKKLSNDGQKTDFWTLRLESLIERVKRQA